VTDVATTERSALADLLTDLGPDAPTLCEGWLTRDLAAHLVLRERRPDAAPGIFLKRVAPHTAQVQRTIAGRPWPELVETVRRRPWWIAPVDGLINSTEYFIHHEDVRRAQLDWAPRAIAPDVAAVLWRFVRPRARLVLRRVPGAVTVTAPGFGSVSAGKGGPPVTLIGHPQELLLFLTGRQLHTTLGLTGPEAIVSRMRSARYGL